MRNCAVGRPRGFTVGPRKLLTKARTAGSANGYAKVERRAAERDKLWSQFGYSINERSDECLLGPLSDVGRAKCIDGPMAILLMCNHSIDATKSDQIPPGISAQHLVEHKRECLCL